MHSGVLRTTSALAPGLDEGRYGGVRSAAVDAVLENDAAALELLFRAGTPVNLADRERNTLLMLAAGRGHLAVARLLLERGADTERRNARDRTPIGCAASRGDIEMARLLVSYGADPLADQGRGRLPVDFAALAGHRDVVRYLQFVSGTEDCLWRPVVARIVRAFRSLGARPCACRARGFFFVGGA